MKSEILEYQKTFPKFMCATYGVYISQLIRICRICDNYSSFLSRHKLLTERLVRQGFWYNKLCITFKKFARRYNVLISKYGVSIRAHVTEGICIPLVAKPDLIRNVTICGCAVVVVVGLHDCVSIILYLTITVRHYTLGTTLHCTILASFPVEKRWMKVDVLML